MTNLLECDPGVADPGVADPGVADPGVANPGVARVGVARVGVADSMSQLVPHLSETDDVEPGQPVAFTDAAAVGDCIRQGDLYLIVCDGVPEGYTQRDSSLQLVPGTTNGARHCLSSPTVVYWPASDDELLGPCFRGPATVIHPVHGSVAVPEGITVRCHYQREFDKEERRARD